MTLIPAADAICHHSCSTNFRKNVSIPGTFSSDQPEKKKENANEPFLRIAQYIEENDDQQVTVADLTFKMQEFLGDAKSAYSTRHMKEKLMEHFGENIIITSPPGKTNL